ncbi:hypothetical protein [Acetobacter malorum]|uniref:hypothetical protein n=1 Tax=Acetobacter malorum TaxID=178901 RepID=UPI00211B3593|nr:hypothetical protein [Acetobacter malorum]
MSLTYPGDIMPPPARMCRPVADDVQNRLHATLSLPPRLAPGRASRCLREVSDW